MRNLKKVLALVLALMMALSLMATASASDYADDSGIEKTEAVEVMSMINVFQGTDGGNFDPNGNLTRAQAAKIISYMKLGAKVADVLPKDSAPFDDVKADRWYTGYVTYAKAEGIINGRSEQVFDPNGNVTGYEFGKMVLEAAGIKGEYSGTSAWQLNISTALRGSNPSKTNLMENVDAVLSLPITREQACQLAFNALNYTPDGAVTEYVVKATDDSVIYRGTNALEAYIMSTSENAKEEGALSTTTTYPGSLGETVFSLKKSSTAEDKDEYGAPATTWSIEGTSTSIVVAKSASASYTAGVTGGTIYNDLGKPSGELTVNYIVDGKSGESVPAPDSFSIAKDNKVTIGGNGTKVDVYKDGSTVTIVVVNTYVTTIKSFTAATEDTKASITLDMGEAEALTFTTDAFTADDVDRVVLYNKSWDKDANSGSGAFYATGVTVPDEAQGAVTRVTDSAFVMGGVTYKYGANKNSETTFTNFVKNDATVYLDQYGYLMDAYAEEVVSTTDGVIVDIMQSGSWASASSYQVKVLLADGSIVEKGLNKVGGSAPNGEMATVKSQVVGKIVKFSEKDGAIDVVVYDTLSESNGVKSGVTEDKIERNKPQIAESVVANSKTVFLIGNGDGVVTAYTGISAVPSIKKVTEDSAPEFQVLVKEGVATLVYIAKSEPVQSDATSSDLIYIAGNSSTKVVDAEYDSGYFEFDAVVNGEKTTVKVKEGVELLSSINGVGKDVLLKSVTTDAEGLITGGTPATGDTIVTGESNSKLTGGNLTIGDKPIVTDENTVAFTVSGGKIEAVALDKLAANEEGVAVTAYTKDSVLVAVFVADKTAEVTPPPAEHTHSYTWEVDNEENPTKHIGTCTCAEGTDGRSIEHAVPTTNENKVAGCTVCQDLTIETE